MPEEVEMRLTIPPALGPEAEVLAELRERVQVVEAEHDAERRRTARRVLGPRAVLQQSWRGFPSSVEPRRNRRPHVASRSKWLNFKHMPELDSLWGYPAVLGVMVVVAISILLWFRHRGWIGGERN